MRGPRITSLVSHSERSEESVFFPNPGLQTTEGKEFMERHFEKDLNELKERLLWMGSLAERAVHQSVHAVLEADEQLAKRVLDE
jgi:hypothetical protein